MNSTTTALDDQEFGPLAAALAADGDEFELTDGRKLRLHIEPDWDTDINDYDCYGKIEWSDNNHHGSVRPDGFTGRAVVMDRNAHQTLWWEAYEELTEEEVRETEPFVRRLIEEGFCQVGLVLIEVLHDSLGKTHEVEVSTAWMGGVDEFCSNVVGELLNQLIDQEDDD